MITRPHHPSLVEPSTSAGPAEWWRRTCWVTERLALSGDLPAGPTGAVHLQGWVAAGITHVIDVRVEHSDEQLVARLAPQMDYSWIGADDDGREQPDDWFDAGVRAAAAALADPDAKVLIHCHMGVNRAPSMAFAVLVAQGWEPVAALDAIRAARPIAAVLYAFDALRWWHRRAAVPAGVADGELQVLEQWFDENVVDVRWIISRIRRQERS